MLDAEYDERFEANGDDRCASEKARQINRKPALKQPIQLDGLIPSTDTSA